MIKECKVVLKNKEVIVVDYDGTLIQMPNEFNDNFNVAYIKYHNNLYSFATKEEYEKYNKKYISKVKTDDVLDDNVL